ncbi:GntR family transcriptional regulator [Clostridium sp. BJN0001]|uniref:GntR family transcriptional regulator n=1 Tax=Clostridium sp. BJN0001 TaxID=2930219 RepID=UPI001FD026D5|nr:GntR family transcriptional regulator [Clostridium sp. BJN0001]
MIKIDPRSSTPIYEQVKLGLKELILKGAIKSGEKIPSVRELAGMLVINPNTISKAYNELEREEIIETLRGKGTFVRNNFKKEADFKKMDYIKSELKKIILEGSLSGISEEQFTKIVKEIYKSLEAK